ncbi:aminomethyltransferase family protein [Seohaeicola zhoushanensis]|uniref:Glycine cleavage system protein T n=1 Tax=Seohaeicola zhoushanensis TaxID=1569283 RepID=A0A8J3GXH0_9RHOB|nr:aminomethyltransferase family protein [Seohaeicola zhoushanensis]GHF53598.1 glycine cleavage system protein T [Seohaeicola zhoushanensis]
MDARVTSRSHVPLGLIPTPFQSRLEALSRAKAWVNWAGYVSPAVLDTVEFEYFAIRNQATLYDITPMHKYRITGPDAEAMLNRLVTRDLRKVRPGRVAYVLWCDEDGKLVDDGTLFRLGAQDFRLCCQEPMAGWLADAAWGFEVSVEDESHRVAGLALQGPTSFAALEAAGLGVGTLRPFDLAEVEPGLHISRTGFTGDLGYELWTGWGKAAALWDRLWAAGQGRGLRAIGFEAMNIARIEAGFIAARTDFQPSNTAMRLGRGRSPVELGLSRMVDFTKGHFNGRRALLSQDPQYHLVRLDVGGFKPADGALIYHRRKKEVGHVTSGVWSPTAKRNIALAELRAPFGARVTGDLWAEIYVNAEGRWDRRLVPVTIQSEPFFKNDRARATPPGLF